MPQPSGMPVEPQCAILGLRSPQLDTLERAAHLGNSSFNQPLEEDELDIPAVRGLSGSVRQFVGNENGMDRLWETEFSHTAGSCMVSAFAKSIILLKP